MAIKYIIDGDVVGGSTDTATSIHCKDADGNDSNVQVELDKQNNKFAWKEVSDITEVPITANEVVVIVREDNYGLKDVFAIPYIAISETETEYPILSFYNTANIYGYAGLWISLTSIRIMNHGTAGVVTIEHLYYR